MAKLRSRGSPIHKICLVLLFMATLWSPTIADEQEAFGKAFLVKKIGDRLSWPFSKRGEEIHVGIIGVTDPVTTAMRENYPSTTIKKVPIKIHQLGIDDNRLAKMHIVYIGQRWVKDFDRIQESIGDNPVLTVADSPDFLGNGGMLHFVTRGGLKPELRLSQMNDRNLKLIDRSFLKFSDGR